MSKKPILCFKKMQKGACPSPIKTNDKGSSLSNIQDKPEILESSFFEIKYKKRSPRVMQGNKNVGDTTISKTEIVADQTSQPERRRKKNQIENLRLDLSPKFIGSIKANNKHHSSITQKANTSKHFEKSSSISSSSDSTKGSLIDSEPNFLINVGEIFWGKISSGPYWPCIVLPDPGGRTILDGKKNQEEVHVKFFADKGRRAWVKKSQMLPFCGETDFNEKAQNILNKMKKTRPTYKAFIIPARIRNRWEQAIEEAENVCRKSLAERGSAFEKVLADSRKYTLDDRTNRRLSRNVNCKPSKSFPENKMAGKRNRSPTPESKMHEKIDDLQVFAKKRKIDVTNNPSVVKKKTTYTVKDAKFTVEENIYESVEFKTFFGEMKEFVIHEKNELLESCLQEHVSKIWLLRLNKDKRLAPPPYIKIKSNRPVAPVKLHELEVTEMTACECKPNAKSPCGPYSGCINRFLLIECSPKVCPAGNNCQNQMFEKHIYPSLKPSPTRLKGWGLFCNIPLTSGTFIIEYVGEVINDSEFQRRIAKQQEENDENYYFLSVEKDYIIDSGSKGNLSRFMNHSCEPNCVTQKWSVNGITRIGIFAITDIPMNTELTINYNLECIGDTKAICHCGAVKCSGFIGEKYKEPQTPTVVTNKVKKQKVTNKVIAKKTARRQSKLIVF